MLARYQALRLTNIVGTGWYRYQASFELNKSLWLHYAPLYYEFQYYPDLGMFPDGHHFAEVYKDQNLAGIWLEAGAAIAMIITATVFLPRYMSLGALVKWAWAAWGSST